VCQLVLLKKVDDNDDDDDDTHVLFCLHYRRIHGGGNIFPGRPSGCPL